MLERTHLLGVWTCDQDFQKYVLNQNLQAWAAH